MEKSDILISAVRYLHATYDIELDLRAANLLASLEHHVSEMADPVLMDYWQDFCGEEDENSQELELSKTVDRKNGKSKPKKTKAVYYRGTKVEQEVDDSGSSGKSKLTYRGVSS